MEAVINFPRIKNGSKLIIGSNQKIEITIDHHFNLLQKKMWKFLLGIKILGYSEE